MTWGKAIFLRKKLMVIAAGDLMLLNACFRILLRRLAKQILVIKSFSYKDHSRLVICLTNV